MSYKHYGRLIGKIDTGYEALTGTSPANTTTPFNNQAPGTKFMAYGENSTSLAFNRAFSALATNIDSLADILGSPSLRSQMLRPARLAAGQTPTNEPGFRGLNIDEETNEINLAGLPTEPPIWVYCGLTKDVLQNHVKLFNIQGEVDAHSSNLSGKVNRDTAFANFNLKPEGCREKVNGGDYFSNAAGQAQTFHSAFADELNSIGMPLFVPPIRKIRADLVPYNGSAHIEPVHSWDSDGAYILSETPDELALRPGCFVELQNNGDSTEQSNNGLFRIAEIARNKYKGANSDGSKLILTRGNLHRVTVNDDFLNAGDLVSWQSTPNHAEDTFATPEVRTNFAHVMYKIVRDDLSPTSVDLYLNNYSGPDGFANDNGQNSGLADPQGVSNIKAVSNYGSVGLADQEDGAGQNWSMPIGTRLFGPDSTHTPGNAQQNSAEVLQVLPAGYPVVFDTTETPGQLIPCTPPGFLLNPVLTFPSNVLPGNNYLWVKSLTTVGEQLRSRAGELFSNSTEDASSEPYQTRQDVIATETFLNHLHHGVSVVPGSDILNQEKSPTANILGPSLWKITATEIGQNPFNNFQAYMDAQTLEIGKDFLHFFSGNNLEHAIGRPISHSFNADTGEYTLVISDVARVKGFESFLHSDPIEAGYTFVNPLAPVNAHSFEVQAVLEAPYLSDANSLLGVSKGDLNQNRFVMDFGLNAAFHAQSSSNETIRSFSAGYGNIIWVPGGARNTNGLIDQDFPHRPFTTILEGVEPDEVGQLIVSDHAQVSIAELQKKDGTDQARIRHDETIGTGSLTFRDRNTELNIRGSGHDGDIPLSGPGGAYFKSDQHHLHSDFPGELQDQNILGAFEGLLLGNGDPKAGNFGTSVGDEGVSHFGVYSNGVFYGGVCYSENDVQEAWQNDPVVNMPPSCWDGANHAWVGAPNEVAISEAYVNVFGAKHYIAPTSIIPSGAPATSGVVNGVQTDGERHRIIFYNVETKSVEQVGYQWNDENGAGYGDPWDFPNHLNPSVPLGHGKIPLAYVHSTDAGIVKIIDIRQRICKQDKKTEVYVGQGSEGLFETWDPSKPMPEDVANRFAQGAMHFPTIGHALTAISLWNSVYQWGRSYTIKVVGPTFEVENPSRGIHYPLTIPTDSLTIEGLGGHSPFPGDPDSMTVKTPLIKVFAENSLFNLNGRSDLTFRNLSIEFDSVGWTATNKHGSSTSAYDAPSVNAFVNLRGNKYMQELDAIAHDYGRIGGPFYSAISSRALQENILIERVHVRGDYHMFFHHGTSRNVPLGNVSNAFTEIPFDNLTIKDCSSEGSYQGFVCIGVLNSVVSMTGQTNGHANAQDRPYYWRNINIIGCRSVGRQHDTGVVPAEITDASITDYKEYETSLTYDGIYLSACKEVTIRDNFISNHVKGITLGVGDWSHFCTGQIENNRLVHLYGDGITANSDSDSSGITITGNTISSWGHPYNDLEPIRLDLHTHREARFAAICISGNDIKVAGNTMEDTHDYKNSVGKKITQGILITNDVVSSSSGTFYGISISNNSLSASCYAPTFLRNDTREITVNGAQYKTHLVGMSVQGNTLLITSPLDAAGNLGLTYDASAKFHPAFHNMGWDCDWDDNQQDNQGNPGFGCYNDSFALDLGDLQDSIISNNTLAGHVSIDSAIGVSITDNGFPYPSAIVDVRDGGDFLFTGNTVNNGHLRFYGSGGTITNNNFSCDHEENYPEIYAVDAYDPNIAHLADHLVPQGVFVTLMDTYGVPRPSLIVSGNTFSSTPTSTTIPSVGGGYFYNNITILKALASRIVVAQGAPEAHSQCTIIGNSMIQNGAIELDATMAITVSGNTVDAKLPAGGQYVRQRDSLLILNKTVVENEIDVSHPGHNNGLRLSKIQLSDNTFGGNVIINGCYFEFNTWDELNNAMLTGERPADNNAAWPRDGSFWNATKDSDGSVVDVNWMHNKISHVSVIGNTVGGCIELIAVEDSTISNNRLSGMINSGLPTLEDYAETKSFYTRGQIAMLSCTRNQVTSCKFADLFVLYSSFIQCSDSTVGFYDDSLDEFGYRHLRSIGTYSPTEQGRIFAGYSNHINVNSCQISTGRINARPDRQSDNYSDLEYPGRAYMNRTDGAVYSSLFQWWSHSDAVPDTVELKRIFTRTDNVMPLSAINVPAFSVSNCHLRQASFSACDDLQITNNRFYGGGEQPSDFNNLVIHDHSMRPGIHNNHFTASVEIGDLATWEDVTGHRQSPDTGTYTVKVETDVYMPVHAQVVGNRFDSAVGKFFNEWKRHGDYNANQLCGKRNGCGNLVIHNYGGSLISNNHMMKSPFGYMMHSGALDDFSVGADRFNAASQHAPDPDSYPAAHSVARRDQRNRIGGFIRLDPNNSYPLENYTKAAVTGRIPILGDSQQKKALHVMCIGTGVKNGRSNIWDRDSEDAPRPWAGLLWAAHDQNNSIGDAPTTLKRLQEAYAKREHIAEKGTYFQRNTGHTHDHEHPYMDGFVNNQGEFAFQNRWTGDHGSLQQQMTWGLFDDTVLSFPGISWQNQDPDGTSFPNNSGTVNPIAYGWGGANVFNWFADAHNLYMNGCTLIPDNPNGTQTGRYLFASNHFPKTLGAFVIGNVCKDVMMDDRVRNSSWAYGRTSSIRVDRHGTGHLPAQAFETPLNPQHANNHANFNMVRRISKHLDLSVYGNFGSYVIKSNPELDKHWGPERGAEHRAEIAPDVTGEIYRRDQDDEYIRLEYTRLSAPSFEELGSGYQNPYHQFRFDMNPDGQPYNPWDECYDLSSQPFNLVNGQPPQDGQLNNNDYSNNGFVVGEGWGAASSGTPRLWNIGTSAWGDDGEE